ncbi:hypothetical protein CIK05_08920 [Bdellovibrio sp. qaytius]|nr:hypothetical protein CIK05_08920 [Bdellovibrio sp. qaytius]
MSKSKKLLFLAPVIILALTAAYMLNEKPKHADAVSAESANEESIALSPSENKIVLENKKEALEELKQSVHAYKMPEGLNIADFEHQYLDATEKEIEQRIHILQNNPTLQKLIQKGNVSSLTVVEVKLLAENMRETAALHKILLDRKIKELQEKI